MKIKNKELVISTTNAETAGYSIKTLADGNYVYNGSFQEGKNRLGYWEITKPEHVTAEVTGLEDGRRLKVVSQKGTESTAVTVGQKDLALAPDTDYVLSFTAQAQEAKTMTVHAAGQDFQAELTGGKKKYSFSFKTAADLTDKNISFDLGLYSRGCYGVFCYSLLYMQNVQNRLQNVEMFC